MFFQESHTIEESLYHIQNELFEDIHQQWNIVILRLQEVSVHEEQSVSLFESASKFKSEFDALKKLYQLILIPAVRKCLSEAHCVKPFDGFTVLRSIHEKQRKALDEMRSFCDAFLLKETWSESKRGQCWVFFRLHQSFTAYLNYAESTLIPLLKNLRNTSTNSILNERQSKD
jgi:hypothetical protein